MNRFIWLLVLLFGFLHTQTYAGSNIPSRNTIFSYRSGIIKKAYTSVENDQHANVKFKFKKRRIRDSVHIITFYPESNFEQHYFSHTYIPIQTQLLAAPVNSGQNIRRGPPTPAF